MSVSSEDPRAEAIRARLTRPVVLIGLMGAGKSKLGKGLAHALDLPLFDSDHEVEQAAGCPIPEIFDRFGETAFREGEAKVITRLMDQGVSVIATGGGAIMMPETVGRIWDGALSVWVRADLEVMLERTSRSTIRPLLQRGDPETILQDLMRLRYPVYERADLIIDSTAGPAAETLDRALTALEKHLLKREGGNE